MTICNRSHARRATSGEIKIYYVVSLFDALFEGNLLTQRHEILSQETRDSRLSQSENQESLSHMGLIRYRDVSPGQTDGQTELR